MPTQYIKRNCGLVKDLAGLLNSIPEKYYWRQADGYINIKIPYSAFAAQQRVYMNLLAYRYMTHGPDGLGNFLRQLETKDSTMVNQETRTLRRAQHLQKRMLENGDRIEDMGKLWGIEDKATVRKNIIGLLRRSIIWKKQGFPFTIEALSMRLEPYTKKSKNNTAAIRNFTLILGMENKIKIYVNAINARIDTFVPYRHTRLVEAEVKNLFPDFFSNLNVRDEFPLSEGLWVNNIAHPVVFHIAEQKGWKYWESEEEKFALIKLSEEMLLEMGFKRPEMMKRVDEEMRQSLARKNTKKEIAEEIAKLGYNPFQPANRLRAMEDGFAFERYGYTKEGKLPKGGKLTTDSDLKNY